MTDFPSSNSSTSDESDVSIFSSYKGGIPDIPPNLKATLQHIVDDVVSSLGCVGAMVATLEPNNTLPVRAYAVDFAPNFLKQLEGKLGISLISPKSVAYLDEKAFKDNLSVRAVRGDNNRPERFIVSESLHDLFRPVVNKPLSFVAQQATGIKQVIAVPFFLEDEVVGNLFAATRTQFSSRDIDFLIAFGHQAATAIQSQRRLAEAQALESIIFDLQATLTNENDAFRVITDAVVNKLGYLAAFVAPVVGDILPVRAYTVNSKLVKQDFVERWQNRLGFDPLGKRAVAYLDDLKYSEQLSVRAVKSGQIQVSDRLYDLVRPVLREGPTNLIQGLLHIKQVIAIPFFLDGKAIGNLYVVSQRAKFSPREQEVLRVFAQHAAISIRNAQTYSKSENRREIAQIFAKMAFFANTAVHDLNGAIGLINANMYLVDPAFDFEQEPVKNIMEGIAEARALIQSLEDPFRDIPDEQVDLHVAIARAARKVNKLGVVDVSGCALDLPKIISSVPVLSEIFRIFFKNGLEAMKEAKSQGRLMVSSRYDKENSKIIVTVQDTGTGIKAENLTHIFDFKWTTKQAKGGLGFGLFWAKEAIENLNGEIEVDSVFGQGTSFRIFLPVSKK